MNYYHIQYSYESEVEATAWKKYDNRVLVQADTFEEACDKIVALHIHRHDRKFEFVDLTIR